MKYQQLLDIASATANANQQMNFVLQPNDLKELEDDPHFQRWAITYLPLRHTIDAIVVDGAHCRFLTDEDRLQIKTWRECNRMDPAQGQPR